MKESILVVVVVLVLVVVVVGVAIDGENVILQSDNDLAFRYEYTVGIWDGLDRTCA